MTPFYARTKRSRVWPKTISFGDYLQWCCVRRVVTARKYPVNRTSGKSGKFIFNVKINKFTDARLPHYSSILWIFRVFFCRLDYTGVNEYIYVYYIKSCTFLNKIIFEKYIFIFPRNITSRTLYVGIYYFTITSARRYSFSVSIFLQLLQRFFFLVLKYNKSHFVY